MPIKVIDALCGQGKSESVIQMMQDNPSKKFLYVAPYLAECHRVAGTYFNQEDKNKLPLYDEEGECIYNPESKLSGFKFKHPTLESGTKGLSLCSLLEQGENVVSTHALFTELGSNAIEAAKEYTLIIDEAVNVYENDSRGSWVKDALAKNIMYLDDDGITIRFDRSKFGDATEKHPDTAKGSMYETIAAQCDLGQLLLIRGKAVVWEMSADLLNTFNEVYICTYMFEGSEMSNYLHKKGLSYEIVGLPKAKKAKDVAHLIDVVDDKKLNSVGETTSLSSSAFKGKKKDSLCDSLRRNLHNIMYNKWNTKAEDRLWTCFVPNIEDIGTVKYKKQHLPFNYKATNDYINVHNVAFLIDSFTNPMILAAAESKDNNIDQDRYAISVLIQFVFRSAVRKGEPIKLYLPSLRMRELLERWKQGEFDE